MIEPYPGDHRQSGRTRWALNRLLDAVSEGQPSSVFVGNNQEFLDKYVYPLIYDMCLDRGLEIESKSMRRGRFMLIEGCEVYFRTPNNIGELTRTRRGIGEFWDHFLSDNNTDMFRRHKEDSGEWEC